jgi:hypothetical protein
MIKLIAPIFLCTLVLTGCGGGGGGGSPTAPAVAAVSGLDIVARTTTTSLNLVNTIAVGDLNNDGLDDVVVGGWVNDGTHTARIYVFYQNANGTLTEKTTEVLPSNTYSGSQHVFIKDFDGDGRNDIFLPAFDDGAGQPLANSVFFWNNSGQFVRQDLADQVYAHGACYNDIDRDGDLDILVSGANGGLYVNNGNRNFSIQTAVLPNDFFATCSVIHNSNNTISIIMGQSGLVAGFKSSILTMDRNFNVVSNVGVVAPVRNGVEFDLINSRAMDVDNDGHTDFVAVFNDMAPGVPGAKQVLLGDGQGNFTAQPAFDTQYNNAYYSHTIFTAGHRTVLFGADNGHTKLYQIINGVWTLYKQDVLDAMAASVGASAGNWNIGHGTVYQNTVNGRVYVLQYLAGKYYTKELI